MQSLGAAGFSNAAVFSVHKGFISVLVGIELVFGLVLDLHGEQTFLVIVADDRDRHLFIAEKRDWISLFFEALFAIFVLFVGDERSVIFQTGFVAFSKSGLPPATSVSE